MKYLLLLLAACGWDRGAPDAARADASPPDSDGPIDAPAPLDGADAPLGDPITLSLAGAIAPVHDPSIIEVDGLYFLYATGTGLPVRTSVDLVNWSLAGQVFTMAPSWIDTTEPTRRNDLWAPDVSSFGGLYHLYYSASTFGSNVSCIGHATSASPATNAWTDRGAVICSTATDSWNAIDPAAFVDEDGEPWLAFGSFWSGLKLIPLAPDGSRAGTEMYALAARADSAVEAPFVIRHGGFYYLFESTGSCCRGVDSTYQIRVGRSPDVRGPYVDADGVALLAGGGTLVVDADARWRGPGHNAILGAAFNVYHAYDANASGIPTLRISELRWTADGWPVSAGP
ncbi:MAG TPA: arabinan endo-1,5-alpha-L-arabinosidase [Kofleriaceae bacterium]|nr:arabinan endo-1,5-alpha-L-arabinosidase [Kofleriaceae bacterium]